MNEVLDTGWTDITLNSGWTMTNYVNERPQCRRIGRLVMLRGLVNATAAAGTNIGSLPEGFVPFGNFNRYPCTHNQNGMINIQVNSQGVISDYTKNTNTARTFLCLNGISFFAE